MTVNYLVAYLKPDYSVEFIYIKGVDKPITISPDRKLIVALEIEDEEELNEAMFEINQFVKETYHD